MSNPFAHHNHRVIATNWDSQVVLTVHEVYYDEAGRPVDHDEPSIADGTSLQELHQTLTSMARAAQMPVLTPETSLGVTIEAVLIHLPRAA